MQVNLPLMEDNITQEDIDLLIDFLKTKPRLTQGENVRKFEEEWSKWLGVGKSVYVNSGASANLITIAALRHLYGDGEIILPPLNWVSDIASVLQNGFKPVFVDISPSNLGMDERQVLAAITERTRAVFITYVQGFNCLSEHLHSELEKRKIILIEDVCESHGATLKGRKLGSFGLASNFSFYFAHHMSTIEGGMVCTNDEKFYETVRMLRSHGMVREMCNEAMKREYADANPDLNPDFIFAYPAYNVRGTEIGGVLGRSQLRRLDGNNEKRRRNFELFLSLIDPAKYQVDFEVEGSCNYAFPLIIKKPEPLFRDRLEKTMREQKIEFRRGSSGGGNQLRQPYLKGMFKDKICKEFPAVEHVHFYGYYIGNYPTLPKEKIVGLCEILNGVS